MTTWASPSHVSLSFSIALTASSRSSQHRMTEQTTCKELSRCLKALKPSSLRTRQLFLNTFLGHVLSNRMLRFPEAKWRPFLKYCAIWFPLFLNFSLRLPQNCFVSVQQFQDLNETLMDWNVPSSVGGGSSCASKRTDAFLLRSITKGYSNAIIDLFIHNVKV